MNILSTIHSKYQGETMFCFVCVATVFGYILGVNRVIDAIILKHSGETRVKVVRMLNKYTQTNLSDLSDILASNHLILSRDNQNNIFSSEQGDNQGNNSHDDIDNSTDNNGNDGNDGNDDDANETTANLNSHDNPENKDEQEKQIQENTIMSPSSTSSVSTSEEDYELVRKNENVNHLKNKNNMKYFEWLNIF